MARKWLLNDTNKQKTMKKRRYETPRTEIVVVVGERILNFASETTRDNFSKEQDFLWPDEDEAEYEDEYAVDYKDMSLWDD